MGDDDDQVLQLSTGDTDDKKMPSSNIEGTPSPPSLSDLHYAELQSTNLTFENEKASIKRRYSDDAINAGALRDNTLRHNLSKNMLDLTNINDETDSSNNNENLFELKMERNDISDEDLSFFKSFSFDNLKEKQTENYSSDEEDGELYDSYINDTDSENSPPTSEKEYDQAMFFEKHKPLDTISETSESEDEEENINAFSPLSRQKVKLSTGLSNLFSILESPSTDPESSFLDDTFDIETEIKVPGSEEHPTID